MSEVAKNVKEACDLEFIFEYLNKYDLLVLILLSILFMLGFSRGFIRDAIKVFSLLLSLGCAKLLAMPLAVQFFSFIDGHTKLVNKVSLAVNSVYTNSLNSTTSDLQASLPKILDNFGFLKIFLGDGLLKDAAIHTILKSGTKDMLPKLTDAVVAQIEPLVLYLLSLVVFLILCFLFSLLLGFISKGLTILVNSIPLVGVLNSILGGLLGILKGACVIVLLSYVLLLILPMLPPFGITAADLLASKTLNYISTIKDIIL